MPAYDRKKFFDGVKERIDPTLDQEQVDGLEFLLGRMEKDPFWRPLYQMSYGLATVFHETGGSFQPVEEGYYLGSKAKVTSFQKKLRYYPFFGRGFVQLTWEKNYRKATKEIREQLPLLVDEFESRKQETFDLVIYREQALDPLISYAVLTLGMHQGWFGNQLDHYVNDTKKDYVGARHSVNGTDKAGLIAGYAKSFEKILIASKLSSQSKSPTGAAIDTLPDTNEAEVKGNANADDTGAANVPAPVDTSPSANITTTTEEPPAQTPVLVQTVATEKPPETVDDKLTKWSARWAAIPTAATAAIAGMWSWLTSGPMQITLALIAAGVVTAIIYFGLRQIAAMKKLRIDKELTDAREQRELQVQLALIATGASKDSNTVHLIQPPPVAVIPTANAVNTSTANNEAIQ